MRAAASCADTAARVCVRMLASTAQLERCPAAQWARWQALPQNETVPQPEHTFRSVCETASISSRILGGDATTTTRATSKKRGPGWVPQCAHSPLLDRRILSTAISQPTAIAAGTLMMFLPKYL